MYLINIINLYSFTNFNTHQRQSSVRMIHFLIHTEKYFRNLITSNRNQIVFTMHRLIWNKTNVSLLPNQSENGKYNLISI